MIEKYKTKHILNPIFMRDVFAERNNQHNLRNENNLRLPVAKTTTYGLETIENRGYLFWFYNSFLAMYWPIKEELPNKKFTSLTNLAEQLGVDVMKYFKHHSVG